MRKFAFLFLFFSLFHLQLSVLAQTTSNAQTSPWTLKDGGNYAICEKDDLKMIILGRADGYTIAETVRKTPEGNHVFHAVRIHESKGVVQTVHFVAVGDNLFDTEDRQNHFPKFQSEILLLPENLKKFLTKENLASIAEKSLKGNYGSDEEKEDE